MDVIIEGEPFDGPAAAVLREAQRTELDARYGCDDHEPGPPPTADDVPVFLVARDGQGRAVGCGGLRFLEPGVAEIKRMYVEPAARGTGVATAVLRALEERARAAGVTRLVLETGTLQPDAIRFYRREGYRPIDNFGPYIGADLSVCFARDLVTGLGGRAGVEAFYRRYNRRCNDHRFDELGEFVAADVRVNGDVQGLPAYVAGLKDVVRAFPDYRWDVRHLLIEGEWISAHFVDTGTHRDTFLGVPATGRSVELQEFALYRLESGRIAEVWVTADNHRLAEQLR